jgi:hypothetical protein
MLRVSSSSRLPLREMCTRLLTLDYNLTSLAAHSPTKFYDFATDLKVPLQSHHWMRGYQFLLAAHLALGQ